MNYLKLQATSLRLITKFGRTVTLSRKTGGTFDAVAGEFTTEPDETTGDVKAVVLTYTTQGVEKLLSGNVKADNTLLVAFTQGRLRKLLIAAKGAPFQPVAGDTVTGLEDSEWTVIGCNPLDPSGSVPLVYDIAVSRK